MNSNEKFISGAWYDEQYGTEGSLYHSTYTELPEWAWRMNLWHVDYITALLGLMPGKSKILDLGSGIGYYVRAWMHRGFDVVGAEISKIAVKNSGLDNIKCTSITDLSMFDDGQFDLAFSGAVLEHIDDSVITTALTEIARVAKNGAHVIGHERGNDPGHINIKTPDEWHRYFSANLKNQLCGCFYNTINPDQPVFLHIDRHNIPAHIEHYITKHIAR